MSSLTDRIRGALESSGAAHEIIDCDPSLADTADFCAHYGYSPDISANAILVRTKTGEEKYALCVVLATTRLNVNHTVRKKFPARKVSFASADETRARTGMEIGGVTPVATPEDLPIWVDAAVMRCDKIVLGGGGRDTKIIVDPSFFETQPAAEVVEDLALPIQT